MKRFPRLPLSKPTSMPSAAPAPLRIRILASALLLSALLGAHGAMALTMAPEYIDGPETCRRYNTHADEHPIHVQVPIDYLAPAGPTTPLYAWTRAPFDPSKPTAVFVNGGPGDTAHGTYMRMPGWNLVFFDQRGNSCSKPMTAELYRSRSFYSSENTARDIDEIREHLGVDTISVYGVSYGTVPAHIYGHLFPSHARAVVLEGVIHRSDESFFEPKHRHRLLQEYFLAQPRAVQARILELSKRDDLPENWFSVVALTMLYMDDFEVSLNRFLKNVIWDDAAAVATIRLFIREQLEETEFGFNEVMMGMIGCQEMSMNTTGVSLYSVFKGRRLVSDRVNSYQNLLCRDLGFRPGEANRTYDAGRFPTHVPTTYLQGARDGATVLPNAIEHYERARAGFGQILIFKTGGHIPVQGPLASGYGSAEEVALYQRLLGQALSGQPLDVSDLRAVREIELKQTKRR